MAATMADTCMSPMSLMALACPNVVPEGVERFIGCAGVVMPWGIAWLRQYPALCPGPRVTEAQPAETIRGVRAGVDPLYPDPATKVQPEEVCNLDSRLDLGETAATANCASCRGLIINEPYHISPAEMRMKCP